MPSPITMLAVIPTLQGGGAERVMLTLLRHLDRQRFRATLVVVDGRQRDLAADLPAELEVLDLNCARVRHAAPALWRLIRARRPGLVFSTLGHLNLMLAMMRPALPRTLKLVGRETINVSENLQQMRHPYWWRLAYRWFYPRLDFMICQSRAMQSDLCGPLGFPLARTVVIPNPVDVQRIRQLTAEPLPQEVADSAPPGTVRLVAAGRLSWQKGFDRLIEAVSLCNDLPLQLDILGQGPEEAALQQFAQTLGVAHRVRLRGFISNPYPWFRRADALVLSSRFEGQPNVVLEALACGTPAICTPVPCVSEILLEQHECMIAADHSPQALAQAIRKWFSGTRTRAPDKAVAHHAVDEVTRRYERALERVAGAV